MADVEHNTLVDPELHEPKGIAAASANQVYVADGAAGGAFTQITPASLVMVHSASDLPTAAAGVRTLADNTTYFISGTINIGSDRLVGGINTTISGTDANRDNITSTTTGNLITSSENLRINDVGFTCASGAWLSLSGGGTKTFGGVNFRVTSCDTLGTVDAMDIFHAREGRVDACTTDGITFTGTGSILSIESGRYDSTAGTIFDLSTSVWDTIYLNRIQINNPSGVTGIVVAASSANLASSGIGYITNNFIETVATASSGYSVGDLKWIVKESPGMQNNTGQAQGSIEGSALNTSFTGTGAGNDVPVNFGTAFVADLQKKFTISTAGVITYTGTIPITVYVDATIFGSIAGGAARQYNFYIAKNSTIISSSVSKREYDGANVGANSCNSVVDLVTNDTIILHARAETATTNLNVDTCSITVLET